MNSLKVTIATPNGEVYNDDNVKVISFDTHNGSIGIMANHEPMVTTVKIGIIKVVKTDGTIIYFSVDEGFVECHGKEISIIVKTAENAQDINKERAEASKERAEKRLANNAKDIDIKRAQIALSKSLARLKAVELIKK